MNKPHYDALQRPLQDLRISVTDRCNFRCTYCMPADIFNDQFPFLEKSQLLSFEEIERLVHIFAQLGVTKLRITGGEPLLRKDLPSLIKNLSNISGIEDIALTTNGALLPKYLQPLAESGLQRLNISLDSLDDTRFGAINGVGQKVEPILNAINLAVDHGFQVKINMVVKKGVNDQDILPMASYFKDKGITLRYIEFMDVGNQNDWNMKNVVPSRDIVELIHQEMPLESISPNYFGEVATRYKYKDRNAEIGLISSVTQAFCSSCTRARISANGDLYTCLFASKGFDLKTLIRTHKDDLFIRDEIANLWKHRDDRYSELRDQNNKKPRSKVEMWHIGG